MSDLSRRLQREVATTVAGLEEALAERGMMPADDAHLEVKGTKTEVVLTIRLRATELTAPVVPIGSTLCTFGRPKRDHARPCSPGCDFVAPTKMSASPTPRRRTR